MQWSGYPARSWTRPNLQCPLSAQSRAWTSRYALLVRRKLRLTRSMAFRGCVGRGRTLARAPGLLAANPMLLPSPQLSSVWLAARTAGWTWKYSILASVPRAEALAEIRQPGMLLALCSMVEVRCACAHRRHV